MAGTVRKVTWTTRKGETRTRWQARYFDQSGTRRKRNFLTRKAADAWLTRTKTEIVQGVHVPDAASATVAEAGELWLKWAAREGHERSTIERYRSMIHRHLMPLLGNEKLSRLTTPQIEIFRDALLERGSRASAIGWLDCLKGILTNARRLGLVVQNAAHGVRISSSKRDKRKLEIGRDVPSKEEIKLLVDRAEGLTKAIIVTAAFTGLRFSEILGLTWDDVDFTRQLVHVRQRADYLRTIGPPKSAAGERKVPMAPLVVRTLREWRLQCPRARSDSRLHLVFPNHFGEGLWHGNFRDQWFYPLQVEAGLLRPSDAVHGGKTKRQAKYSFHCLRHFFASRVIDQGFSPKRAQELLGHGSIKMTFDLYGHLFPDFEGDHARLAKGEAELFG
jgi:integrase